MRASQSLARDLASAAVIMVVGWALISGFLAMGAGQ